MKAIFFFILLPIFCTAQEQEYMSFRKIDSCNFAKAELYNKSKIFVVDLFKSPNDVIQLDDKEIGRIVAKGAFTIPGQWNPSTNDYIHFTLTIDVKDKKYRIVIDNLEHKGGNYKGAGSVGYLKNPKPAMFPKNRFDLIKRQATEEAERIIENYATAIKNNKPTDDF